MLLLDPPLPVTYVEERLLLRLRSMEPLASEPRWELQELHGGGFLQTRGYLVTYVAPPSAGTYHVLVQAGTKDGGSTKLRVAIRVLPTAAVEPAATNLSRGSTVQFAARIKGLPRSSVTWSVEEPEGGSIGTDGLYRAPDRPGTYHVLATSVADPDLSASATVTVD